VEEEEEEEEEAVVVVDREDSGGEHNLGFGAFLCVEATRTGGAMERFLEMLAIRNVGPVEPYRPLGGSDLPL